MDSDKFSDNFFLYPTHIKITIKIPMSRWAWLLTPLHNSQRSTNRGFHRGPHRHMDKRHLVAKRTNPDQCWRDRSKPKPWSGLNFVNKFNHVVTVSRFQVTVKTQWLGSAVLAHLASCEPVEVEDRKQCLYRALNLPWIEPWVHRLYSM